MYNFYRHTDKFMIVSCLADIGNFYPMHNYYSLFYFLLWYFTKAFKKYIICMVISISEKDSFYFHIIKSLSAKDFLVGFIFSEIVLISKYLIFGLKLYFPNTSFFPVHILFIIFLLFFHFINIKSTFLLNILRT